MTMKIETNECPETATALYEYQDGHQQPTYLELDPDERTMECGIGSRESTPEPVYYRRRLRWGIYPVLGYIANAIMADEEVQRLAEVICDGYEGDGDYSDEAEEAIEEMERCLAMWMDDAPTCYATDAVDCFAISEPDLDERIEAREWDSEEDLCIYLLSQLDEVDGHYTYDESGGSIRVVEGVEQYAEEMWRDCAPEEDTAA